MIEPHQITMMARVSGVKQFNADTPRGFRVGRGFNRDTGDKSVLLVESEVSIGYVLPGRDYIEGEITVQFGRFHSDDSPWMRMLVFGDAMATIANMPELIVALGASDCREDRREQMRLPEFVDLLKRLGYIEMGP